MLHHITKGLFERLKFRICMILVQVLKTFYVQGPWIGSDCHRLEPLSSGPTAEP